MPTGTEQLASDMAAMNLKLTQDIAAVGTDLKVHVANCTAAHEKMTGTVDRLTRTVVVCMLILAALAIALNPKSVIALLEVIRVP